MWAIYFLFSVIVFSYVIGECVGIVLEYSRWRRLMRTFEGGLTEELLHRMDITHDNQVRFSLGVTCKLVARVVGQCARFGTFHMHNRHMNACVRLHAVHARRACMVQPPL